MSYRNINKIWMEAFNAKFPKYEIVSILLYDACSCVYLLSSGLELRITTNTSMYHFSKELRNKRTQHVAKIIECFSTTLPDERNNEENVFCIISERLVRDFSPKDVVQSGINLFINSWRECFDSFSPLDNIGVVIEERYANKDVKTEKLVLEKILNSRNCDDIIQIATALHDAFQEVKELDPSSIIYLYTDNIGLSDDGVIKICNIGHEFIGLDNCYEIDVQENSVTVKYNPAEIDVCNKNLLIPLKVDVGHSKKLLVLAKIDTGATCSGFSESLFKRACLEDLGPTEILGSTGNRDSINTTCDVEFPNGHKTTLVGCTMVDHGEICILIGMDLLMYCKLSLEPYENGFKYKLVFMPQ